jgi:tetratricopeptide (TPR) repeat protein
MRQGRLEESAALFEEALAIYRETGNRRMVAGTLGNLAVLEQDQGRWRRAIALLEESHAVGVELGDDEMRTMHAFNLAFAYARTGQAEPARRYLEEARVRYGEDWEIQWIDARLTWIAGDRERARELLAAAKAEAGADFEPSLDGAALTDSVAPDRSQPAD